MIDAPQTLGEPVLRDRDGGVITDDVIRSPRVRDVWRLWRSFATTRKPTRLDLNPTRLRRALDHIIVTAWSDERPGDYQFAWMGDTINARMAGDRRGKWYSELDGFGPGSRVRDGIERVRRTGAPLYAHTPYVGPNYYFYELEDIMLPIWSVDGAMSQVMSVVEFHPLSRVLAERSDFEHILQRIPG